MNKLNKLISFCTLLWVTTSCVDEIKLGDGSLQKPPGVDITIDTVFSKSQYAQRFLWDAYSTLYYGIPWDWSVRGKMMNMGTMEALTDNYQSYLSWDVVNRNMYTGSYSASQEVSGFNSKYNYYDKGSWQGIRKAYLFIENSPRVPDMSDKLRKRLCAEAKMIIACHYCDMFRHFGGLPIVREAYSPAAVPVVNRATAKETLDFIVRLCDEAEADLPWSLPPDERTTWDGRFTGAAAIGLKIRALLFGASPLFNDDVPYRNDGSEANTGFYTWFGGKNPQMWQDVVDACVFFFTKNESDPYGGFALYTDGDDLRLRFQNAYFKRGTCEMLISTRIVNQFSYNEYLNYFRGPAGAPVLEYLDLFTMKDGKPFDNSVWNKETITPYRDPWSDRDPRMYETCILNGQTYQDRTAEIWFGGRERGNATDWSPYFPGAGNYKYGLDGKKASGKPAHWAYLRMAEIYLSYAEALNETGSIDDAINWLNNVRSRVGLDGLKESNPGITWTKELLREELLNERSREFGREEVRWFDMIRWKREDDFRKRLHGLNIYKTDVSGEYRHVKFTLSKRFWQDGDNGEKNFDPKWYLSAFPLMETYKTYHLPQNPGW